MKLAQVADMEFFSSLLNNPIFRCDFSFSGMGACFFRGWEGFSTPHRGVFFVSVTLYPVPANSFGMRTRL